MALSEIHVCQPAERGALWYYQHILTALQSDAFDGSSTWEMWASYLALVLADREQPPLIVHAPEGMTPEQREQFREAWNAARANRTTGNVGP